MQKYTDEAIKDKARFVKEMASYTPPPQTELEKEDTCSTQKKKRKKKDPAAPKGKKTGAY